MVKVNPQHLQGWALASRAYQRAFTIVEVIIVVAVVGILSAVIIVNLPSKHLDIRAQAEQFASSIRYVQSLGMTKGARYRINFSSSCAGGVSCYWISDRTNSTTIVNPATQMNETALVDGVSLSTANSEIIFNGLGRPYISDAAPPGGTPLASDAVVTLSAPGASDLEIVIIPETGAVYIQE